MRRKQTGVTFIGWIFLLIPIAMVGYAGLRLVPIYLNFGKVAKSMAQVASEAKADASTGQVNPQAIKNSLEKRLDVEGIDYPELKDFAVRRDSDGFFLEIDYEETVPFIGNVALLTTFKKSVPVGRSGG
jgi:hypothetical protein